MCCMNGNVATHDRRGALGSRRTRLCNGICGRSAWPRRQKSCARFVSSEVPEAAGVLVRKPYQTVDLGEREIQLADERENDTDL